MGPNGDLIVHEKAPSCWSKPKEPPILGQYPIQHSGTCRVCLVQNGTGEADAVAPDYAMWVRDDQNHAIGGIDPFSMAPSPGPPNDINHPPSGISFSVGATQLQMWSSLPDGEKKYVTVYMVWGKQAGYDGPETMRFDTRTDSRVPLPITNNCALTDGHSVGATIEFSCHFKC